VVLTVVIVVGTIGGGIVGREFIIVCIVIAGAYILGFVVARRGRN
jgi:hypothetical protein